MKKEKITGQNEKTRTEHTRKRFYSYLYTLPSDPQTGSSPVSLSQSLGHGSCSFNAVQLPT